MIAECVVDVCLSRTMKKEGLARLNIDFLENLIKCLALVWIESVDVLSCQLGPLLLIISLLLNNERISHNGTPILLEEWNIWPIPERLVGGGEEFVNEEEIIIQCIIICGMRAMRG